MRAPHMMKLDDSAGSDAERRTSDPAAVGRVVGLVGFGGLWTANRARKNWLRGQGGGGGRSGLGAQTGVAGGTSGLNWGHNRLAVGGFEGFVSGQTWVAKLPRGEGLFGLGAMPQTGAAGGQM